jgi:uncharacterized protein (TIGR03437 family)
MVLADFNSDGRADLAALNGGSQTVSLREGKGDGTFGPAATFRTPQDCAAGTLLSGDFNGDGNRDLLGVCLFGPEVFVLLGHGDGTFGTPLVTQLPQEAVAGNAISSLVGGALAEDFTGDGKLDLLLLMAPDFTTVKNNVLYLLPGRGDGTFDAPQKVVLGPIGIPVGFASGDFDGNGATDLAVLHVTQTGTNLAGVAQYSESVAIEMGTGGGNFRFVQSYPWSGATYNVQVADVNGDGIADLVSDGPVISLGGGGTPSSAVAVYRGMGGGQFQLFYTDSGAPGSFTQYSTLADVASQGRLDIVEAQWVSGSGALAVRMSNGAGTFQPPLLISNYPSATLPLGLAAADLNSDGRVDLVFLGEPAGSMTGLLNGGANNSSTALRLYSLLPPGNALVLLNTTGVAPPAPVHVNGASFAPGPLAASAIVSAFGSNLAGGTASASSLPPPATLDGVSVSVLDSAGVARPAQMLYVSPSQVNYVLPAGLALGTANITISSAGGSTAAQVQIANVSPGLFNVNTLAVGSAVTINNGVQTYTNLIGSGGAPVPVPVATTGQPTYLVLYGTGIRNHTTPVTVNLGTSTVTATYAGPQGTYAGLDQINVPVPASLAGAGAAEVTLHADGAASNTVLVDFQ